MPRKAPTTMITLKIIAKSNLDAINTVSNFYDTYVIKTVSVSDRPDLERWRVYEIQLTKKHEKKHS
jgi:hypothetical protein